ncbi:MAG: hypothetical protein CL676_00150 [Bdellovibrionaceae bacterium]|nr:hypothetical protein [Pseudobdellovibrionaceae bacterium]
MKDTVGTKNASPYSRMQNLHSKTLLNGLAILLCAIFGTGTIGCSQTEGSKTMSPTQTSQNQGGDNSGGGDTSKTNLSKIENHIGELKLRMRQILFRVQQWDKSEISDENIKNFFQRSDLESRINDMTILTQSVPCGPERDKAGFGDQKSQTVCLSTDLLRMLPKESYSIELDALAFHELGHLVGLNEVECQMIQKWLLKKPWISDLSNHFLRSMVAAYDSTLSSLGDIVESVARKKRVGVCRRISSFEVQKEKLAGILSSLPGSAWKTQLIPEKFILDEASNALLPILNWSNDVCINSDLTQEERIQILEQTLSVSRYLMDLRVQLATYEDNNKLAAKFPALGGIAEILSGYPILEALKQNIDPLKTGNTTEDFKKISCRLTERASGRTIELKKDNPVFDGTVLDSEGNQHSLRIKFGYLSFASVITSFSDSDLHLTTPSDQMIVTSYFDSVFGVFVPFAPTGTYDSFELSFYVSKKNHDNKSVDSTKMIYDLNCGH